MPSNWKDFTARTVRAGSSQCKPATETGQQQQQQQQQLRHGEAWLTAITQK